MNALALAWFSGFIFARFVMFPSWYRERRKYEETK